MINSDVAGWKLTLTIPQANGVRAVVAVAIADEAAAKRAIGNLVTAHGTFEPMTRAEVDASGLAPDEVGHL